MKTAIEALVEAAIKPLRTQFPKAHLLCYPCADNESAIKEEGNLKTSFKGAADRLHTGVHQNILVVACDDETTVELVARTSLGHASFRY